MIINIIIVIVIIIIIIILIIIIIIIIIIVIIIIIIISIIIISSSSGSSSGSSSSSSSSSSSREWSRDFRGTPRTFHFSKATNGQKPHPPRTSQKPKFCQIQESLGYGTCAPLESWMAKPEFLAVSSHHSVYSSNAC